MKRAYLKRKIWIRKQHPDAIKHLGVIHCSAVALYPFHSLSAQSLCSSIFARLYEKLASFKGDVVTLQIGDTYLEPPHLSRFDAAPWNQVTSGQRDLYAYAPPAGYGPFVQALATKVQTVNRIPVSTAGIQVTAGATHALSCATGALLDPGDEIILLSPHWPLIAGIARSRSVAPVEVTIGPDLAERLQSAVTPKTAAIYLSTPNNPCGTIADTAMMDAVAHVAIRNQLWILSDEVYEDYCYDGTHSSIGARPDVADRTVTVFSFSKSYGQAGLRVGYCAGSDALIASVRKMANHTVYNVPQAMQMAAHVALNSGAAFLCEAKQRYVSARDAALAQLRLPVAKPTGATYLFLDLGQVAGPGRGMEVLEKIAAAGVLLAPGAAFGEQFVDYARLCFTAVPPQRLAVGIDRINQIVSQ
jgi:N-succinyldiaminopimelate aminotransferase